MSNAGFAGCIFPDGYRFPGLVEVPESFDFTDFEFSDDFTSGKLKTTDYLNFDKYFENKDTFTIPEFPLDRIRAFAESNNCTILTSNMLGYDINFAYIHGDVYFNVQCETLGEPEYKTIPFRLYAKGSIIFYNLYHTCKLSAYKLIDNRTVEKIDKQLVEYNESLDTSAVSFQTAQILLENNSTKYCMVFTIKNNNKQKPNDLCLCGSGKKYKKCCLRGE